MSAERPLILLVDDEVDILKIYGAKIQQIGYDVVTAQNGAEAIEVAKKYHPDLVLLDVKMPVMDGADAAIKLKEDPETKDIKIVFLTAFGGLNQRDIDIKYSRQIGALDFITKGMDLNEFSERVKSYFK